jgi:formylglycine-generating enzyme required for sulfatase activity
MRQPIFLLLCTLLLATTAPEPTFHAPPRPGKDHALFFAVQDYDNWTDLNNPIRDAEAIAQQLRTKYEFDDLKIVTNPTLETIQATLNQYLTKTYGSDDQLFIFFSGHGAFNDLTTEGFFIPKAGLKNDPYQNSYLPLTRLERIISNIPCAHILLTIDACYSGTFNESIALDKSDPTNPTWRRPGVDPGNGAAKAAWITAKLAKRSRICITSGGKERTSDGIEHSPLTEAFLKGLANPGEDAILTVEELIAGLKNLQPGPKTFTFGTHLPDASFLFIQQEKTASSSLQSYEQRQRDIQAWTNAKTANTLDAYSAYLRNFSQGEFRELAEIALQRLQPVVAYNMILIPGGSFQMGSDDGESDEKPIHTVNISSFYLSKYQVTVEEFKQFIDATGYQTDADKDGGAYSWNGTKREKTGGINWRFDAEGKIRPVFHYKHPVIHVSWNDATAYCKWLSQKTGLTYRLPTEAEWEYAAGNGSKHTKYSWGEVSPVGKQGGNVADETAAAKFKWIRDAATSFIGYSDGFASTAPVGVFNANDYGLFDMSSNVSEWCQDWYDASYYVQSLSNNPQGPNTGSYRVIRGGSWNLDIPYVRVANRSYGLPSNRRDDIGFRLARHQ